MPTLNHIHTIRRLDKQRSKCGDPYCSFIVLTELMVGKVSLCNVCGLEMILTKADLKRYSIPRCVNCKDTKSAKAFRAKKALLENLLNPMPPIEPTKGEEQ